MLESELETTKQALTAQEAAPTAPTLAEPIAIVGMGCRFPGADNPAAYWQLLIEGQSAVRDVLPTRWIPERYAALETDAITRASWARSGFLDQVDQFDPLFFRISPLEAISMEVG